MPAPLLALREPRGVRARWLAACGSRPSFARWASLGGREKRELLHEPASEAGGVSAYEQAGVADLLAAGTYSVEHVVPRSKVNGSAPGDAEDDPVGWIVATRSANSKRSNFPLLLWPDTPSSLSPPNRLVRVDGELHWVPPNEQRARLARKWLFVRATYPDEVAPASRAQRRLAALIVANVVADPAGAAEAAMNEHFRAELGWSNPLVSDPEKWVGNAEWRALVFGWG